MKKLTIPQDVVERWMAEPEFASHCDKVQLHTITDGRLKALLDRAAQWGYRRCEIECESGELASSYPSGNDAMFFQ